ncbi:hypothetical protein Micbo1qcDRAFT_41091 [Microdochium bolleyi]|uniref:Uncharacterized protein n=1 Tax=Microdochium bolleyi TaxID=196109 RepID=A0A136JAA9_9PEZI|nr:hypothetical protein Micbo1qcDRAFT_41091 [Microdochium bolleyi]
MVMTSLVTENDSWREQEFRRKTTMTRQVSIEADCIVQQLRPASRHLLGVVLIQAASWALMLLAWTGCPCD